jgi:predicted nucleotidyltransferase
MRSLLQYFAFVQKLEKILGCHVDVITTVIEDTDFETYKTDISFQYLCNMCIIRIC